MALICPTITAYSTQEYKLQMEKIAGFTQRLQIDLTDGEFTEEKTVGVKDAWWPVGVKVDLHLMYQNPLTAVEELLEHKPHLVIVHAEASVNIARLADMCKLAGTKLGLALLPQTPAENIANQLARIDHILIFSGNLGHQGGSHADLSLLSKVALLKRHKSELEIGWDGGVNDQNVSSLVAGGVDVLNTGGFIQNSPDPERSFMALQRIADETGTT